MGNKSGPVGEFGAGVQSVDRAAHLLEILAHRGDAGVSELAVDIGVHKSTAFRLLSALEERNLVEQTRERGKYRLGLGILRLATTVPGRLDLVGQGRPVCEELAAGFGETVNLAVLRSHHAVNVDQSRAAAAIAALLAHQPIPTRKRLLDAAGLTRYTARTITSRRALAAQLTVALADGFATTSEEYEDGLNAVAAPVVDHTGTVVAAVSVSGPAYRFDAARMAVVTGELIAGAAQIGARLGYFGPG